tara:strand:- start:6460 stop:14163 length:7704 start_codon:yes stop_codon:yes gene_type:complete
MAQQTNLNVSPYFDDFNPDDNYHKVLFKPGYPVQAREITGLQSILQNQIEKFGQHFFKEGAKVIPGNTAYSPKYYAVELNNTHLGVPVDFYISQLIGRKIIGLTTGVTAIINQVITQQESERGNLTLYISYMSSGVEDSNIRVFADGELLTADSDIISGPENNAFIPSGESFASCIANNATATAASFSISNGVYFIRGNFVNVSDETIILSQYGNSPSARIGLRINEDIINSDEDETLADNSKGFNNYAAPGADRLKISTSLYAKPLDDFNDSNFIELAVVEEGVLKSQKKRTEYSFIADEMARRTYEESGDYSIRPFDIVVKNSLNDGTGNNGVYEEGEFTQQGTLASDDLAVYQVGPGKAFVKGYEIETISSTYLDAPKPRTTKTLESQGVTYNTGNNLRLNRVYGAPTIGIGNTYIISLRDQRSGDNSFKMSGSEIGLARVYDYALESGSYSTSNSDTNEWDISLYDIQLTTRVTLNENINLTVPTYVKGRYSGATGFLKNAVSESTSLELYDKQGDFLKNEPFDFNGESNNRVAIAVTSYGMSDVKQLYGGPELGNVGAALSFCADIKQKDHFVYGEAKITKIDNATGICTVTSENELFPGILKINNILAFGGLGNNESTFARITEVGTSSVKITGVSTVTGLVEGEIPSAADLVTPNLRLVQTPLESAAETCLYTLMPRPFVSDVDLTDATLTIRKSYSVDVALNPNTGLGQLSSALTADTNESFLPFDEERYIFVRPNGDVVALTDDMFLFTTGNTVLQIEGLGSAVSGCTLVATLTKSKPTPKTKRQNRVNATVINNSRLSGSGIGATTLNDGLVYGNFAYGNRVQDERISLNQADVIRILGIFESNDTSTASAPKMTLASLNGPTGKTTDLIEGERIVGADSGAIGIYTEKVTDAQITYIVQNQTPFEEGEVVTFNESKTQGLITTLDNPSKNISANYTFTTGQKNSFYDYGFVTRKTNAKPPKKGLKVYFSNGFYESTDDGDITVKNSYDSFNYSKDIPFINGELVTDTIDIRPKVAPYTVVAGTRSPLEFYGRSFTTSGGSAKNILASDESIITNFSFYVGRRDRIFLDKTGKFQIQYGEPSEKMETPVTVEDAIEIAMCEMPPYLFQTNRASLNFMKHKRYRMQDIKRLEDRIKNLEYYTSLSLIETETANMFIPDADGMNKFKSGFFVDNFTGLKTQETRGMKVKNSIDTVRKELRPQHYTTSIDLQAGPVENVDPAADLAYLDPEGTNVRRQADGVVTLDYTEVDWLTQQFATRTESVTPFLVSFWQAAVKISPNSDTWTDTARIEAKIVKAEGDFAQTMADNQREWGVDPQTGMSPIHWNAWETTWTGSETNSWTTTRQETSVGPTTETIVKAGWINGGDGVNESRLDTVTTTTTVQDTHQETFRTGTSTRTGIRKIVTEQWDNESFGDRVVSRDVINVMRSRNVEFIVSKCKPLTQLYAFFDGVNVTKLCTPKLMEISMESGTFQVGETVIGTLPQVGIQPEGTDAPFIKFRVAQADHRSGPYNAPTETFKRNPYISQVGATALETFLGTPGTVQVASSNAQSTEMPTTYSATSTILNVDTKSLSDQPQGDFFGFAWSGMTLRGETSGAQAGITNLRLISDLGANCLGSFYIPNPNSGNHPRFETGKKSLRLIDSPINDKDNCDTFGEDIYTAAGTLETVQETIVSIRNAKVETRHEEESRPARELTGSGVIGSGVINTDTSTESQPIWYDPLAQSFQVTEKDGVFITSCDIYFQTKDDMDIPMTFQIRTMKGGFPTQKILPFSEIVKTPDDITVSQNGTLATKFTFDAPVFLEGANTEYCICLASWSTKYKVFISRIGESDILTDEFISQQPYLGSLFKSQNASTWDPSQWEDLKFHFRRAEFEQNGTLELYNPILSEGNAQVAKLMPNSININSNKVRIGIGTALSDTVLQLGNTIAQAAHNDGATAHTSPSNATGNYVGNAGIATGDMSVINAGLGYTPASGSYGFTGVGMTNITGTGDFVTADVHIVDGTVGACTVTASGSGYTKGDVLGIATIGNNNVGRNARLSIVSIGRTNELILDDVQGNFALNGRLTYTSSITGLTTSLNTHTSGGISSTTAEKITVVNDGLHFSIDHLNHGMHHDTNRVAITDSASDVPPTKLTLPYNSTSTGSIAVESTSNLATFENVAVGATNPGLLQIGEEIVKYTGASGGSITGITRGSGKKNYLKGTPVYKYEMGGVSLSRINKTHLMSNVTDTEPRPISFDHYTLKLDQTGNTSGANEVYSIDRSSTTASSFPPIKFNETKSTGGYHIHASQNIPFQMVAPMIHNVTVPGTNVTASMRTVSGTNLADGSGKGLDLPFVDKGYEAITINKTNYLNSARCVASRVNETNNPVLQNFPGDRSLGLTVNLATSNTHLTPMIDLHRCNTILVSNRIDSPISNYKTDPRVNTLKDDPSACQYISRENALENPATSIKIILNAHINKYTDIRCFYAISATPGFEPTFIPFPGFNNFNNRGQIIELSESDGRPDKYVIDSDIAALGGAAAQFREYTFSTENIPSFKYYRVKFVLSGTDQTYVPKVSDLRVITLA